MQSTADNVPLHVRQYRYGLAPKLAPRLPAQQLGPLLLQVSNTSSSSSAAGRGLSREARETHAPQLTQGNGTGALRQAALLLASLWLSLEQAGTDMTYSHGTWCC
jgi:hypothetical protein